MTPTIIRVFFRDEHNLSLKGVAVSLVAILSRRDEQVDSSKRDEYVNSKGNEYVNLGTLVSNEEGYVSFKSSVDPADVSTYSLNLVGHPEPLLVIKSDQLLQGSEFFTVQVRRDLLASLPKLTGGIAIQNPDKFDYNLTGSGSNPLASQPSIRAGDFDCSQLIPNPDLDRHFQIQQIAFDVNNGATVLTPSLNFDNCDDTGRESLTVMDGLALDYEVVWSSLGHSLGELLHSFSLAPCEEIKIAVMNWKRQEFASRVEDGASQEELVYSSRRDQMMQEAMDATVKEKSFGFSLSATIKKIFGASISAGVSKNQLASNTSQRLTDSIKQNATAVRSLHSTVVVETSQEENQTVQTRIVKNHNKCHTLNMMYYEVLRHFEVYTSYKGSQRVLLVHYCVEQLDEMTVAAQEHLLKPALLDPSLAPCFEALKEKLFCCDAVTTTTTTSTSSARFKQAVVTLEIGDNGLSDATFDYNIRFSVQGVGLPILETAFDNPNDYAPGSTVTKTVTFSNEINPADVTIVGIRYTGGFGDSSFHIAKMKVTYQSLSDGMMYDLFPEASINATVNINQRHTEATIPEVPDAVVTTETGTTVGCEEYDCCVEKLMNHIQGNLAYYNTVLWLGESTADRGTRLSPYEFNGAPLLAQINLNPLGAIGHWVAYEYINEPYNAATPPILSPTSRVVLPTRGVFAEALLGNCSSCELIEGDETGSLKEYRDFECGEAPGIADVSLTSPTSNNSLFNVSPQFSLSDPLTLPDAGTSQLTSLLSSLSSTLSGLGGLNDLLESLLDSVDSGDDDSGSDDDNDPDETGMEDPDETGMEDPDETGMEDPDETGMDPDETGTE